MTHQSLVRLFLNHQALIFDLARRCRAPVLPAYDRIEENTNILDDPSLPGNTVQPDVVVSGIESGKRRHAVVLEVQLRRDFDKEWSVVLYRGAVRYRLRCPTWSIIFSPKPGVRAMFRHQMYRDEPELRPLIVTPEMIPEIRDQDAAVADYPKAVMSAVMHGRGPNAVDCVGAAVRAVLHHKPRDHQHYIQAISGCTRKTTMQQARQTLPRDDDDWLTEWEKEAWPYTSGLEEGTARGLEEGQARGLRASLLTVLHARALDPDEPTLARIEACTNLDELRSLVARAVTISTANELFAD